MWLVLQEPGSRGPDGVQRLAARLGAGALPSLAVLCLFGVDVSDAEVPRRSPPPWGKAPCRGLSASIWITPPSVMRGWWPSRRPCGGSITVGGLRPRASSAGRRAAAAAGWRAGKAHKGIYLGHTKVADAGFARKPLPHFVHRGIGFLPKTPS